MSTPNEPQLPEETPDDATPATPERPEPPAYEAPQYEAPRYEPPTYEQPTYDHSAAAAAVDPPTAESPQEPEIPPVAQPPADSPYSATPPQAPPAYEAPPPAAPPAYGQTAVPPPYPGQYAAPPGQYGAAPGYGYGGNTSKNSLGTWALVLGILGIVCCGFFAAIPAIILGNNSQKAAAQGLATNGNQGKIGMILGWVGIGLSVLGFILAATTSAFDAFV